MVLICSDLSLLNRSSEQVKSEISYVNVKVNPSNTDQFITLPKAKSKSFSAVKSYYNSTIATLSRSYSFISGNFNGSPPNKQFSILQSAPKTWNFKSMKDHFRKSTMSTKMKLSTPLKSAHITIIYSNDTKEWSEYLSDCFRESISVVTTSHNKPSPPSSTSSKTTSSMIVSYNVSEMSFPISCSYMHNFTQSLAVLFILSPDLLKFIDSTPQIFELCKILDPNRTVAMFCGIEKEDMSRFHMAALVAHDLWVSLIAKDQDKDFVLTVIQTIYDIIAKQKAKIEILENNDQSWGSKIMSLKGSISAQFKITPKKVKIGNKRIYVLLKNPLKEAEKIRIQLETKNLSITKESIDVPYTIMNPYTLQFDVPEPFLTTTHMIEVSIYSKSGYLGHRQIKCDTLMSELYSVLSTVNNPYELLCQTFGLSTHQEIDTFLAKRFEDNLPETGFNLLNGIESDSSQMYHRKKSENELPTLMHFAAKYGLQKLITKLLQCPGADSALKIRNEKGKTACELAFDSNYVQIQQIIEDFLENNEINETHQRIDYIEKKFCMQFNRHKIETQTDTVDLKMKQLPPLVMERRNLPGVCLRPKIKEQIYQEIKHNDDDKINEYRRKQATKELDRSLNRHSNIEVEKKPYDPMRDYDKIPTGPPKPVFNARKMPSYSLNKSTEELPSLNEEIAKLNYKSNKERRNNVEIRESNDHPYLNIRISNPDLDYDVPKTLNSWSHYLYKTNEEWI